ncbi:MAG: hypothetical protein ACRDMV_24370 [Streptosporangiales bacterium]
MNGTDIAFLAVGVAIVIVVGRLLAYSGRRYIGSAAGTREGSGSAATLVSVVFHLVALGLLAFISALPIGGGEVMSFMMRLGVLLLVLGGVYGIAIAAVARRRQAEITEAAFTGRQRPASLAATPLADPTAPREVPPEAERETAQEPVQPQEPVEQPEPQERTEQPRGPQPRPARRQRDGT